MTAAPREEPAPACPNLWSFPASVRGYQQLIYVNDPDAPLGGSTRSEKLLVASVRSVETFCSLSTMGPLWVHYGSTISPLWVHYGSTMVHYGSTMGSLCCIEHHVRKREHPLQNEISQKMVWWWIPSKKSVTVFPHIEIF